MKIFDWNGEKWTMREIAEAHGVRTNLIEGRLNTMTLEQAVRDLKYNGAHPTPKDTLLKCEICQNQCFKTKQGYLNHYKKRHNYVKQ